MDHSEQPDTSSDESSFSSDEFSQPTYHTRPSNLPAHVHFSPKRINNPNPIEIPQSESSDESADDDSLNSDTSDQTHPDDIPIDHEEVTTPITYTRSATWNVNTSLNLPAAINVMQQGHIHLLAIQEPFPLNALNDHTLQTKVNHLKREAHNTNYELFAGRHGALIVDYQHFNNAITDVKIEQEGRVISAIIKGAHHQYDLAVVAVYQHVNTTAIPRDKINSEVNKALNHFILTLNDPLIIVLGDLNENMTHKQYLTAKQNPNNNTLINILLSKQHTAPLMEQTHRHPKQIYTRRPHIPTEHNNSTLDYIFLNQRAKDMHAFSGIDRTLNRSHIYSDHDLIFTDLAIAAIQGERVDQETTKTDYNKICKIPIKPNKQDHDEDDQLYHKYGLDPKNLTPKEAQDADETLQKLYEVEARPQNIQNRIDILQDALQLQNEFIQHANHTDWNHKTFQLPPRNKGICDKLAELYQRLLYRHIPTMMEQMKLQKTINITKTTREKREQAAQNLSAIDKLNKNSKLIARTIAITQDCARTLAQTRERIRKLNTAIRTSNETQARQILQSQQESMQTLELDINTTLQLIEQHKEDHAQIMTQNKIDNDTYTPTDSDKRKTLYTSLDKTDHNEIRNILSRHHIEPAQVECTRQPTNTTPTQWKLLQTTNPGQDQIQTDSVFSTTSNYLDLSAKALQRASTKFWQETSLAKKRNINSKAALNRYGDLAQEILPKDRSLPEAHPWITDREGKIIRATSDEQRLHATKQHHGRWMATSKAAKQLYYYTPIHDEVGLKTYEWNAHRRQLFTQHDTEDLIHDPDRIQPNVKQAFQDAHQDDNIKRTLKPIQPKKACKWPFYYDKKSKNIQDRDLEEHFEKAIRSIPGKARHRSFHMALFGRLHQQWGQTALILIRLSLLLRHLPAIIKEFLRMPIPKAIEGETRPIALMDDIACFILAIITKYLDVALDKTGEQIDETVAYRKGKGTDAITLMRHGIIEDAIDSKTPLAIIDEDEEMFFDRITGETQAAALMNMGCPPLGYIEFLADNLHNKHATIATKQGTTTAPQNVGLQQGSVIATTVANPVTRLKFKAWLGKKQPGEANPYKLQCIDPQDTAKNVFWAAGYCDDNSRYLSPSEGLLTLPQFIEIIQQSIRDTGNLSLVTKLGRKGAKTEVTFYNIRPDEAHLIPKHFDSYAWSYKIDGPLHEHVTVRLHLRDDIPRVAQPLQPAPADLIPPAPNSAHTPPIIATQSVLQAVMNRDDKYQKHLGITMNLQGDTSEMRDKYVYAIEARTQQLRLNRIRHKPLKWSINCLLYSITSYAPLQVNFTLEDLKMVDNDIDKNHKKFFGLTTSDATELLHVRNTNIGLGIRSFTAAHLTAVARELEVHANDDSNSGIVIRARLYAMQQPNPPSQQSNFAHRNTVMLANFGIYLRDRNMAGELANRITDLLSTTKKPIATTTYMTPKGAQIGLGKKTLADLAKGEPVHNTLLHGIHNYTANKGNSIVNLTSPSNWIEEDDDPNIPLKPPKIAPAKLANATQTAIKQIYDDLQQPFYFLEWQPTPDNPDPYTTTMENWTRKGPTNPPDINDPLITKASHSLKQTIWIKSRNNAVAQTRLSWNNPSDAAILNKATADKRHPLITTGDGGHIQINDLPISTDDEQYITVAAIALLAAPTYELRANHSWTTTELKPILIRAIQLPRNIGTTSTTNAQAELWAQILALELIPIGTPFIHIGDSLGERQRLQTLRDYNRTNEAATSFRHFIRNTLGNNSKYLANRLSQALQEHDTPPTFDNHQDYNKAYQTTLNYLQRYKTHANWRSSYHEIDRQISHIKVDSHQLNADGTPTARYPKLTPCPALVHANQTADTACNYLIEHIIKGTELVTQIPDITNTGVNRFFFTHNGLEIDQDTTRTIHTLLDQELLMRAAVKPKQGLPARALPFCTTSINNAGNGEHKRLIQGLAKAHTRELYKNKAYRNTSAAWRDNRETIDEDYTKLLKHPDTKEFLPKYTACPLCQDQDTSPLDEGNWVKGNTEHLHLKCNVLTDIRHDLNRMVETKATALLNQIREATQRTQPAYHELKEQLINKLRQLEECSYEHMVHKHNPESTYTPRYQGHLPTTSVNHPYPSQAVLALIPPAQTEDPPQFHQCTATDLAYLGVIPDLLHHWISYATKNTDRETRKRITLTWRQLRATIINRAMIMQACINNKFAELQKQQLEKYKEYITPKGRILTPPLPSASNEPSHNINEPTQPPKKKPKTQPAQSKPKPTKYECTHIKCQYSSMIHGSQQVALRATAQGGVCNKCSTHKKALTFIYEYENHLRKSLQNPRNYTPIKTLTALYHIPRYKSRAQHLKQILTTLKMHFKLSDSLQLQLPPTIPNKLPDYLIIVARYIAKSLNLRLPTGTREELLDPHYNPSQHDNLWTNATITCSCTPTQHEDYPPPINTEQLLCSHCKRLVRHQPTQIESKCPCCNETRQPYEQHNRHPCILCTSYWALANHDTKTRLTALNSQINEYKSKMADGAQPVTPNTLSDDITQTPEVLLDLDTQRIHHENGVLAALRQEAHTPPRHTSSNS